MSEGYVRGWIVTGFIVGGLSFIGGWIYAISSWGWFLGIAFGWFPAILFGVIVGALVGLVWPLFVIAAFGLTVALVWSLIG